jgi:hypothetical protein
MLMATGLLDFIREWYHGAAGCVKNYFDYNFVSALESTGYRHLEVLLGNLHICKIAKEKPQCSGPVD